MTRDGAFFAVGVAVASVTPGVLAAVAFIAMVKLLLQPGAAGRRLAMCAAGRP